MSFSSFAAGRSSKPRPLSSPGIGIGLGLSGTGHLCLRRFSVCPAAAGNGEGKLGGGGKTGDAATEDEARSVEVEHTIPIGAEAERSHSHGNNNSEAMGIRLHTTINIHFQLDSNQTTTTKNLAMTTKVPDWTENNQILAHMMATILTNNSHVSENEGLLSFISVFTKIVFLLKSGLVTFLVMYPGTQKALVNYDDTCTQVICFINLTTLLAGSILLLPFAAHFKGSKSTDHIGFNIFMWALFLWWLFCTAEYCVTLHVYLQIKTYVVWPAGIAFFFLTLFSLVAYIEGQRPTVVSKWAKAVWKKITGCSLVQKINSLRLRSQDPPRFSGR